MKTRRFTEEQIIRVLKEAEAGAKTVPFRSGIEAWLLSTCCSAELECARVVVLSNADNCPQITDGWRDQSSQCLFAVEACEQVRRLWSRWKIVSIAQTNPASIGGSHE